MPFSAPLSLMARWFRRPRGTVRPQEPADLGTAFGLECWLDEAPLEPLAHGADTVQRGAHGLPRWLYGTGRD